jgi:EamA-like transporter family
MDRGRAARDKDKPHTLGHRGHSFRCRWFDLAAVSAEEGPCRRPPGGLGLTAIMLGGGAPMVLVSYGGLVFAPPAHAASLYTALIPLYVAILAAVVLGEAFTVAKRIGLVLIVTGVLGIVSGAGARSDRGRTLAKPCSLARACVGRLHRGDAESQIGRASRCCHCRRRIIDHLHASVRHHFGDQSVQRALA